MTPLAKKISDSQEWVTRNILNFSFFLVFSTLVYYLNLTQQKESNSTDSSGGTECDQKPQSALEQDCKPQHMPG